MNPESPEPFDVVEEGAPAPDDAFPWPPPPGSSWLDALVRTAVAILTRPTEFFRALPVTAPVAPAALFLIVASYAGAGVHLFWQMVLPEPAWLPAGMRATEGEAVASFLMAGPVALAVTTLVALLVHVGLVIFGARRERPRATLAVLCYASVTSILQIVPWLGAVLAGFAGLVITVIGVREVHGTTTGRAAAAVLLPVLAVCALLMVVVMMIVVVGLSTGVLSR